MKGINSNCVTCLDHKKVLLISASVSQQAVDLGQNLFCLARDVLSRIVCKSCLSHKNGQQHVTAARLTP